MLCKAKYSQYLMCFQTQTFPFLHVSRIFLPHFHDPEHICGREHEGFSSCWEETGNETFMVDMLHRNPCWLLSEKLRSVPGNRIQHHGELHLASKFPPFLQPSLFSFFVLCPWRQTCRHRPVKRYVVYFHQQIGF